MSNWIEKFKKLVISSHKQHLIIADSDNLFEYVELKQALEEAGYTLVECKTELSVRLTYELAIRESDKRFLVICSFQYFPPPDIEDKVSFHNIGLAQIFQNLDSKAIKGLSFNGLCLLSNIKPYETLGHEKTLKFLLENLYNVDFDSLTNPKAKERVMNSLITVLLEKNGINPPLRNFLTQLSRPYFPELTQNELSGSNLIQFLQREWELFVSGKSSKLDFEDNFLNKSLGFLFAFGHLKPIQIDKASFESFPKHLRIGLYIDENGSSDSELEVLVDYLKQQIGTIEDIPDQWFRIIQVLSNAKLKSFSATNEEIKLSFQKLETSLNTRFQRFIENSYGSLFSLSGVRKPVVVSRILEHMNASPSGKKAMLVIDGMSFWQWQILGNYLSAEGIKYSQSASLAFIPTITAWSRQAIFKGDKPDLESDNSKESKLFEEYWKSKGKASFQIQYNKFGINSLITGAQIPSDVTSLALVCNDLDEIMHGSILGNAQLKKSTEEWVSQSRIVNFIKELRSNGFQIFITSDHGNIEAIGLKNLTLKDKVGAFSRSKRHLKFDNDTLLGNFTSQNPQIEIGKRGLSIFLKNQEAFTDQEKRVITHGGSHIWEVIVPFITIDEMPMRMASHTGE